METTLNSLEISTCFSSSSLALQPNAGLRLHNGPPPYPSIPWMLLPVPNFKYQSVIRVKIWSHVTRYKVWGFGTVLWDAVLFLSRMGKTFSNSVWNCIPSMLRNFRQLLICSNLKANNGCRSHGVDDTYQLSLWDDLSLCFPKKWAWD